MRPRSIVDPFQSPPTADAFVEAGIPVILSSAGISWYLDSACAGYNHQVRSLLAACCSMLAVSCLLRAVCCVLRAACCVLRAACCVLPAALLAACCVLRAACCPLRCLLRAARCAACCVLRAACCVLPAALLAACCLLLGQLNSLLTRTTNLMGRRGCAHTGACLVQVSRIFPSDRTTHQRRRRWCWAGR